MHASATARAQAHTHTHTRAYIIYMYIHVPGCTSLCLDSVHLHSDNLKTTEVHTHDKYVYMLLLCLRALP